MNSASACVLELPGWLDPLEVLERSRGLDRPALLLSSDTSVETGRMSLFTACPFLTFSWREGKGTALSAEGVEERTGGDPFRWIEELLAPHRCSTPEGWIFPGGAVGQFAYDAGREIEKIPEGALDDRGHPWIDLAFHSWALNWDHRRRRCAALAIGGPGRAGNREAARDLCREAADWALGRRERPPGPELPGSPRFSTCPPATGRPGSLLEREGYVRAVQAVKEHIAEGDCYEVNLSRRLTLPASVDPRRLFAGLARANPAPFAAFIESSRACLVGSSPERFLRVRGDRAESRPIKGTTARFADAARDRRAAEGLLESPKDRAENVMIVDLVRNDLGRVCRAGSIRVPELCSLESYAGVHHLVSCVSGDLAPGKGPLDAVRALFPPGSMTGAPKIRAMEIIDELEPVRRGPYAGAAGYLGVDGSVDLSVIIRSFVISGGRMDLQVGGAVVADSDPEEEYRETAVKGDRALQALESLQATAKATGHP